MFKILLSFEMQQHVVHLNNLNKRMKGKDIKSILNLTHQPFLPQHRATSFKILRAPKVEFFWQDVFRFFLFFKALSTSDRSLLIATEFFKGNVCQIFVQKSCFSFCANLTHFQLVQSRVLYIFGR